jgi:CBS domain-containing protein
MAYVSELIGRLVADLDGEPVGRLTDLIAAVRGKMPHPEIVAAVVGRPGGDLVIPIRNVAVLIAPAIPLSKRAKEIATYEPGESDLYLVRDVLDKQIIDTNGVRVVRVNDLELVYVEGRFYILNVDIGSLGLLRRLGLAKVVQNVARVFKRDLPPSVIGWHDVELLPGDQAMRLKVSGEALTQLHPADLAEILSDLSRTDSSKFLETLDVETLAETLEEVEPDFQASLVETMPNEKVADVLEEMAPDEAADLLAELPDDRSQEILNLMEHDDAEDVRRLLTYPVDTAGGIMNTEYVTIPSRLTAQQALTRLRETAHDAETIFYVYVTEKDNRLVGVFSLRELVMADPKTAISKLMHHRLITVKLIDSQDEIAKVIAKYNLLAVPVVDDQGRLQGIVTADDALDKIIPTAWKKRLPRLYH